MSPMTRPEPAPVPAAPASAAPGGSAVAELELSDDELDRVVGGLERVFLFGAAPEQPAR